MGALTKIDKEGGKLVRLDTWEPAAMDTSGEAWTRATPSQTKIPTRRTVPATTASAGRNYSGMTDKQLTDLAQEASVSMNTDAMNQIRDEQKRRRAAQGTQTLGDRAGDMTGAVFGSAVASTANLVGLAADTAKKGLDLWEKIDGEKARTIQKANKSTAPTLDDWILSTTKRGGDILQKEAYRIADRSAAQAAQFTSQAKEGLGTVGQLAVDVGIAGGQMGLDALTAALTGGSSLVPMAVRAAGSASQEARHAGAGTGQQLAYGLGSAALSVGTEKIANIAGPFKKMFGSGAAEKIAGKLVDKFGDRAAVQVMQKLSQTAMGRLALNAIGEGAEELIEDFVQPYLKRAIYDPDARLDWGEAGYDALIGMILGGVGSGVEAVGLIGRNRTQAQVQTARPSVVETTGTPMQNTVQRPEGGDTEAPVDIMAQEAGRFFEEEKAAPENGTEIGRVNYDPLEAAAIRKEGKKYRNLAAGFDSKVSEFFNKWRNGRKYVEGEKLEKLYLGKLSDTALRQISDILGYEITTRDTIVTNDDVYHIWKDHGNPQGEIERGNLPLSEWVFDVLPEVVSNPDSIAPGEIGNSSKHPGKRGIILKKAFPDGIIVTVQYDNKGRGTLELTTMYVNKNKSGNTTRALDVEESSPQLTSETVPGPVGPTLITTVAQKVDSVKSAGNESGDQYDVIGLDTSEEAPADWVNLYQQLLEKMNAERTLAVLAQVYQENMKRLNDEETLRNLKWFYERNLGNPMREPEDDDEEQGWDWDRDWNRPYPEENPVHIYH